MAKTIDEQLNIINDAKNGIATVLNSKGVEVTEETKFADYPDKVAQLKGETEVNSEVAQALTEVTEEYLAQVNAVKAQADGLEQSKQDVIADLDTIRSGASAGATALQEHQDISGKQDVISDLQTIREGAALGATSLQSHQDISGKADKSYVDEQLATKQPAGAYLTEHQDLSGKQDVIEDLQAIREGAAAGATALQEHQDISGKADKSYVDEQLATKQPVGEYLTEHQDISGKQDVIEDLQAIREGAALGATSLQSHQDISGKADKSYVDEQLATKQPAGEYLTEHQDLSGKQDVIADLDTIREGAAAGATAIQEHQSLAAYATKDELTAATSVSQYEKLNVVNELATVSRIVIDFTTNNDRQPYQHYYEDIQFYVTSHPLYGGNNVHYSMKFNENDGHWYTGPYPGTAVPEDGWIEYDNTWHPDPYSGTYYRVAGNPTFSIVDSPIGANYRAIFDFETPITTYIDTTARRYYTDDAEVPEYFTLSEQGWKAYSDGAYQPKGTYLTAHQDISGKQDVIEDLQNIREGAAAGATAIQEHQSLADYALKSELPTVPTNVSDFTNDAGYLTEHQSLEGKQDVINDLQAIREGAAAGATALQSHQDISGKADKSYVDEQLATKQPVGEYLTEHQSLADYALKSELPTVPTKTSDLTNDSGFLTEHQSLAAYATKDEVQVVVNDVTEIQYETLHMGQVANKEDVATFNEVRVKIPTDRISEFYGVSMYRTNYSSYTEEGDFRNMQLYIEGYNLGQGDKNVRYEQQDSLYGPNHYLHVPVSQTVDGENTIFTWSLPLTFTAAFEQINSSAEDWYGWPIDPETKLVYTATSSLKEIVSGKQDVISDLAAIRSGAALGATALQSHQSLTAYATKDELTAATSVSQYQKLNVIDGLASLSRVVIDVTANNNNSPGQHWYEDIRFYIDSHPLYGGSAITYSMRFNQQDEHWYTFPYGASAVSDEDNWIETDKVWHPYEGSDTYYRVAGNPTFSIVDSPIGANYRMVFDFETPIEVYINTTKKSFYTEDATVPEYFTLSAQGWKTYSDATYQPKGTYLTEHQDLSAYALKSELPEGTNLSNYALKTEVPTKTSDLTNDSGFLTSHQDISGKQDVISDLQAIREGAAAGATALQSHQDISGKQDVISDLQTIREGAAAGATALQGTGITAVVALTQAEYDALETKVATTLYVIKEA